MIEWGAGRLRAIDEDDLEQILEWRNSPRIHAQMYTDGRIEWKEHLAWFERIRKDTKPMHLVFEWNQKACGVVNFTQWDSKSQRGHWGFYLGEQGLPKGTGTLMGYLGLTYAFEQLGIRKLCAEVIAHNQVSIGYHLKLGFTQEGTLRRHILKNGNYEDILCFALFADQWPLQESRIRECLMEREDTTA